jgi:hypothetical protein
MWLGCKGTYGYSSAFRLVVLIERLLSSRFWKMWRPHGLVTMSGVNPLTLAALTSATVNSADYCQKLPCEILVCMTDWTVQVADIAMDVIDVIDRGFSAWQSNLDEKPFFDESAGKLLDAAYKLAAILAQVSGQRY